MDDRGAFAIRPGLRRGHTHKEKENYIYIYVYIYLYTYFIYTYPSLSLSYYLLRRYERRSRDNNIFVQNEVEPENERRDDPVSRDDDLEVLHLLLQRGAAEVEHKDVEYLLRTERERGSESHIDMFETLYR